MPKDARDTLHRYAVEVKREATDDTRVDLESALTTLGGRKPDARKLAKRAVQKHGADFDAGIKWAMGEAA